MPDCDDWFSSALAYRPTLSEYCHLALRPSLDQAAADRLGAILRRAETDPLLDWLIDQADALVAQYQPNLDDRHLRRQQQQLQDKIDTLWVEQVLSACQCRS